jgi:myosin heavy subunit
MMIKLILSISFMFSGCLGAPDSNGMDDVVDHEYDPLPPSTQGDPTATSGHFGNIDDPFSPYPASERTILMNPHVQVNPALAPKATQYSTLTSAQKEKYKATRQLKAQKTKDIRKRKAGECAMLEEENERLRKIIKSLNETNNSKTEEISSLKRHLLLLEQPVRGSPAFIKNTQLRQKAQLVQARVDAAKYKEQAEKEKAQAEKDKAQSEKDKQKCIESTRKELKKEMKDITLDSAAQVGKITNSLKEAQDEVSSCKSIIQTAEAKCSELAKLAKENQIAARAAKTKHRIVQEELLLRKEQHRAKLATVSQGNADYYEDEVAQLNASLEVADLETKIMVDGKATREWGIDYWLGQMKSMMHTTPAVTLKLWEYAMN